MTIVNKELAKRRSAKVLNRDKWATPEEVFQPLNKEFGFTLDPCCEVETAKCERFFTPNENGLLQDWSGESVFMNPPYSRGNIDAWIKKAFQESQKPNTLVVCLIPVSSSSKWWHNYVLNKAEIRFWRGRIKFVGAKDSAPFNSAILIYGAKPQLFREINSDDTINLFE